eukprot:6705757-Prymnesium_polylepis.1
MLRRSAHPASWPAPMAVKGASRERAAAHAARPGRMAIAVAHANKRKARANSKDERAAARGIGRGGCEKRTITCNLTSIWGGGLDGGARTGAVTEIDFAPGAVRAGGAR